MNSASRLEPIDLAENRKRDDDDEAYGMVGGGVPHASVTFAFGVYEVLLVPSLLLYPSLRLVPWRRRRRIELRGEYYQNEEPEGKSRHFALFVVEGPKIPRSALDERVERRYDGHSTVSLIYCRIFHRDPRNCLEITVIFLLPARLGPHSGSASKIEKQMRK